MYIFLIYKWYNDVKKIVKVYTSEQKTKTNPQGFQIQQDQVQSNCLVSNCDHRQQQRLNIPSRAKANYLNLVTGCLREPARWSHYLLIIPESYTDSNSTSNLQYVCAQVCVEGCGTCTWLFCVWMSESPVWGEKAIALFSKKRGVWGQTASAEW